MNDGTKLDYTQLYSYGVHSTDQYADPNILINYKFADLLAKRANIICVCGSEIKSDITGTNLSMMLNGLCQNEGCVYSRIPQNKRISYYFPLNLTATYLTLINDTGFRGNLIE